METSKDDQGTTQGKADPGSDREHGDTEHRVRGVAFVGSAKAYFRAGKVTGHGGAVAEVRPTARKGDSG